VDNCVEEVPCKDARPRCDRAFRRLGENFTNLKYIFYINNLNRRDQGAEWCLSLCDTQTTSPTAAVHNLVPVAILAVTWESGRGATVKPPPRARCAAASPAFERLGRVINPRAGRAQEPPFGLGLASRQIQRDLLGN